jgi:hypothetical protein
MPLFGTVLIYFSLMTLLNLLLLKRTETRNSFYQVIEFLSLADLQNGFLQIQKRLNCFRVY